MATYVIGISAFYHDAACCILRDGKLVAAAEEERFSRSKHDPRVPWHAFRFCLEQAGISIDEVDRVAFYEDPTKKLSRQIWLAIRPGASDLVRQKMTDRILEDTPQQVIQRVLGYQGPIDIVGHHQAHAASSFMYSGFDEAAILTVDGVGEWTTTSYSRGRGAKLEVLAEVEFPHSLGLFYSTITGYLGFAVNDDEYKIMGLAPYGQPKYVDELRRLVEVEPGPGYRLNMDYYGFLDGDFMYSQRLCELLGRPPRERESDIDQFHKDVARSAQELLEEILVAKANWLHEQVPSDHLCMAGGVALNCVANGRVLRESRFRRLFVQPAAGDAGGALGAAAVSYARLTGERAAPARLEHVYVGPSYSGDEIAKLLSGMERMPLDFRNNLDGLVTATVDRLAQQKVLGWFQGRMEFGPRALGGRSIIADPRDPGMRDRINALVKMREAFRPFAPAVLEDRAAEFFELDHPSPYMLETCQVRPKLDLPAVTHVDGSARVQTVNNRSSPRFAALLRAFDQRTECPILLNTSFNVRGEPIVCTPADALLCFVRSEIDALVLEDFIIDRSAEMVSVIKRLLGAFDDPMARAVHISHGVYTLF